MNPHLSRLVKYQDMSNKRYVYVDTDLCELIQNDNNNCYIYTLPCELTLSENEYEMAVLELEMTSARITHIFYLLCNLVEKSAIFDQYLPYLKTFKFIKKNKNLEFVQKPHYFKIKSYIKKIKQMKLYITDPTLDYLPVAGRRLKILLHIREKK